ncbi:hypothetical protein FHS28_000511 [Roseateles terrae]|uniref:Uncharacterized protein n=1 Tax=Roseateles terrae TaxID=431060 RepID=A0ABR6GM12_9BURK|nr:hypothetical protein [Roseateles terrae]
MDSSVAWYVGWCLMAFSIGFAAGLVHRWFLQFVETAV